MLLEDIKDCFFAYIPNKDTRDKLMIEIGAKFNINKTDVIFFLSNQNLYIQ